MAALAAHIRGLSAPIASKIRRWGQKKIVEQTPK